MTEQLREEAATLARLRVLSAIQQLSPDQCDARRAHWYPTCWSNNHDDCTPAVQDGVPGLPMLHMVPRAVDPGAVVDHVALWDPHAADLVACPCVEHADMVARALVEKRDWGGWEEDS